MIKKTMIIVLIICSVFAANINVSAADNTDSFLDKTGRVLCYCLLYIPNRIVDAADMFSFDIFVGNVFAMEMQATRFAQLGGSTGKSCFITKGYSRQYGAGLKNTKRFGLVYGENDVTMVYDTIGSVREYGIYCPIFLTANDRLEAFCNKDVDFWKVGGRFGWFVGTSFGIHPVEVADFFTGIVGIDISEDDF